jgi:hypothetical protein
MTTVSEISLQAMKQVIDLMPGQATDGGTNYLKDSENLTQQNQYWDRGTLWIHSGTHAGKALKIKGYANSKVTFNPLTAVPCVQQVITATVLGTVTGSGNAGVIVTAANLPNSPKTLSVAVLNLDSASAVAGKIRTALAANTEINNFFTIGGSGADITLTTKTAAGNDITLNMSIANGTCTGLTAAPTSTPTTAGVAGPRYTVARGAYPWEQILSCMNGALDDEKAYVESDDDTLEGDGETLEFTLPAGVYNVKRVEYERAGYEDRLKCTHWRERGGKLVFDYGHAPRSGDTIHIITRIQHPDLIAYGDEINAEINRDWLALSTARELLFWGASQYQKNAEYMIEERLNKVLTALKGKQPRIGGPDIRIKSAGG